MFQFRVLHTDAESHPLSKEVMDSLHSVGATIVPMKGGLEGFLAAAGDADAVLNSDFRLSADRIVKLRRCRIISRMGTGVDNIDLRAAASQGILVANVPVFCTEEVANRAFTLLLACACRLIPLDRSLREGEWRSPKVPNTVQIEGQTLGLVGFGKIARAVAKRAQALGMEPAAYDPYVAPSDMEREGVKPCALDSLLSVSDFISLHPPLNDSTRHLIDREALALMKPTAILINCSRGGVIDEAALIAALQEGRLAGAGLDVFEIEPPSVDNPLLKMHQVIVTPHSAAQTESALERVRRIAVENIANALSGRPIANLVPPCTG